ncbi:MAG TPA: M13 family metallopeptidase [Vicinamibacterales bacterium]|nr:M13 family metallopeptidase [Vicinamibacterales bacterium]
MRQLAAMVAAAACMTALHAATQATPASGLDITALDRTTRPQDDLYQFANGNWLARTAIPSDRVAYSAFIELADKAESDIRILVEGASSSNGGRGSNAQLIGDLYASMMNEARIEELGITPIRPELDKIDAIATGSGLAAEAGYLSSNAAGGPFSGFVAEDAREAGQLVVHLNQGGTLLPDRELYLNDDARSLEIRRKYEAYLAHLFTLIGRAAPATDATAVLALEIELARAQWPPADSRDPAKIYNRFTLAQLSTEMPGFDWQAWARPQGIHRVRHVVVAQPSFFKRFATLVAETPLSTWKPWLASRHVTAMAPYLSEPFANVRFEFFGHILTGQEIPRTRWKRGVSLVNGYLGDAVGKLYVERHFPPAAKARAEKLVATMIEAFRRAIDDADWMKDETKREARSKLARLETKVGHPSVWRTYRGLEIQPDDLVGNVQRAQRFENDRRMAGVALRIDRSEWLVAPQTVNAYYNPALNEIVLPAAMLQPPLFDVAADDAVNYGRLGAIIGHELGHGFDERGRRFDGQGSVRDWWAASDVDAFQTRARALSAQASAFSPLAGVRVNGDLTLGENIGDLGGLSLAFRAYRLSLGDRKAPTIDGFTGDQRFFIGWAQVWRTKMRPEFLRQSLVSSPYAPPEFRANGPASNLPGFYEAFSVKPGDKLYRDPAARVTIW